MRRLAGTRSSRVTRSKRKQSPMILFYCIFRKIYTLNDHIELYTDGAASGNPGPGGFGVVLKYKKHRKEISGGYRLTTNNRMELMAVIVGLESVTKNDLKVRIY